MSTDINVNESRAAHQPNLSARIASQSYIGLPQSCPVLEKKSGGTPATTFGLPSLLSLNFVRLHQTSAESSATKIGMSPMIFMLFLLAYFLTASHCRKNRY